jgi:hypothetical protein
MADNKAAAASLLIALPLEVRHNIFTYAATRDIKPKKLLRYWFEKKEIKKLIAQQLAADPNGPIPRVMYHDDDDEDDEDSDLSEQGDDENQGDEDEHYDNDDEDNDEDEDVDDEGDEDEDDQIHGNSEIGEDEHAMNDGGDAQSTSQPVTLSQAPPVPSQTQTALQAQTHDDGANEEAGEDEATGYVQGHVEEDGDEAMAGQDGADDVLGGDTDGTAAPQPTPPVPAPIICAARKWRHIPNFMRVTHCPPPVELLLASKQLNDEAKNWFYDVAILRINATGSFAHTSFFEEAFSQITEAAFSPMENIRKVEVTFVWDTTWLRADDTGCAEAVFPALLRQRSDFVYQILSQAPDLNEVTIHWHDSAQDNESANFMLDVLAPFHSLNATVKIQEHYIAADDKPYKDSIAGKRRIEFQAIIEAGLDRLF